MIFTPPDQLVSGVRRIDALIQAVYGDLFRLWASYDLWSWRWFILLALTVLPWIAWVILRKKESTARLLAAGFAAILLSGILDHIGMILGLWDYYSAVVPMIPPLLPWDLAVLPVALMLFLQYRPNVNKYIKAAIFSGIASFVAQPLFVASGIYDAKNWRHYYSFPILFVIYLICHAVASARSFEKLG